MKNLNQTKINKFAKILTASLLSVYATCVSSNVDLSKLIYIYIPSLSNASLSPGGQYVGLTSIVDLPDLGDNNTFNDVVLYHLDTKKAVIVSKANSGEAANANSFQPSVASGARFVSFTSSATNLVSDDSNNVDDIFIRDLRDKKTTRVSVNSMGIQGNNVSRHAHIGQSLVDGKQQVFVAFTSLADNLVDGDTNNSADVFVRNVTTGETKRVSVDSAGNQASGSNSIITNNGRFVAFASTASLLKANSNHSTDTYIHDNLTGATVSISDNEKLTASGETDEYYPTSISYNGKLVTVIHYRGYLLNGHLVFSSEEYLYNLDTKKRTKDLNTKRISANTKYLVYLDNTVNNPLDLGDYVKDRVTGITQEVNSAFGTSSLLDISANGNSILVAIDTIREGNIHYVYRQF